MTDTIDEIRARHAATENSCLAPGGMLEREGKRAHADRATLLRALDEAQEELSIWQSVFPDIAPDRVLPDRSKLEAELLAMARRVEGLEHTLTLCADQFRVLRRLAEGGQIHKIEPGNKRVRISLSKAVASECEISEAKVRAALKEPGQ